MNDLFDKISEDFFDRIYEMIDKDEYYEDELKERISLYVSCHSFKNVKTVKNFIKKCLKGETYIKSKPELKKFFQKSLIFTIKNIVKKKYWSTINMIYVIL